MWILIPQRGNLTSLVDNSSSTHWCKNPYVPVGDTPSDSPRSGTQSIERAIAVLECFAGSSGSLGLSDIARTVGLTPSTTHRLLRALVAAGYVDQQSETELYRLGLGLAVLGQRALEHSGYHLARPVLDELSVTTGESASLGIRRGNDVVVIERASSPSPLRFDHPAGAEIAIHASAMGKVLVAFSGRPVDDEIATLGQFGRFTEHTLMTPSHMRAELDNISTAGYATNVEERYDGVCGIAAPVCSTNGLAHAAVGVQGPSVRLTPARLAELAPVVIAAANDIASLVICI